MRYLTQEIPELQIVSDFQTMRLGTPSLVSLRHGMVVIGLLQLLVLMIRQRVRRSVGFNAIRTMFGMVVVVQKIVQIDPLLDLSVPLLLTSLLMVLRLWLVMWERFLQGLPMLLMDTTSSGGIILGSGMG